MPRKTPPIAKQVVAPKLRSNALFQARLIDFDTGSDALETQHKAWLRKAMTTAASNSMYRIRLVGYASKLGSSAKNSNLSYARIRTVLKYMQSVDRFAMDRTETFRAVGEDAYSAAESDNSAEWRAVEAHIFIGDIPPPPPPNVDPIPHIIPPLPGGPRFTKWEVASPGGVVVTAGVGGGFNVFFIKNSLGETRGYLQPVAAAGVSVSIPGLKMVWRIIQQILTGAQYSNMSYTAVTSRLPVTWDEMGKCLVGVAAVGGGIGPGKYAAAITFTAAGVWQYGPTGVPLNLPGGELFHFTTKGSDWQLGAGGSGAVGPIFLVGS